MKRPKPKPDADWIMLPRASTIPIVMIMMASWSSPMRRRGLQASGARVRRPGSGRTFYGGLRVAAGRAAVGDALPASW
ncbi:MAG: hypothetical protein ACYS15_17770 [Planctomycetota bacterium]